jgi:hypothetical protein
VKGTDPAKVLSEGLIEMLARGMTLEMRSDKSFDFKFQTRPTPGVGGMGALGMGGMSPFSLPGAGGLGSMGLSDSFGLSGSFAFTTEGKVARLHFTKIMGMGLDTLAQLGSAGGGKPEDWIATLSPDAKKLTLTPVPPENPQPNAAHPFANGGYQQGMPGQGMPNQGLPDQGMQSQAPNGAYMGTQYNQPNQSNQGAMGGQGVAGQTSGGPADAGPKPIVYVRS